MFWNQHHSFIERQWNRYAEHVGGDARHRLAPGANRMLVVSVRIEDSRAKAWTPPPGHDEFWKFLGPYGWSRGYRGADGKPVAPGLIPTLEESVEQRTWLVGRPRRWPKGCGSTGPVGLEDLTIFPNFPGDSYKKSEEQMARFMEEVVPLLA